MDRVNRLLWASCLCIFWGLAGVVVETVSEGTQITPRGLPGATLLIFGMFTAAIGVALVQLTAKIEVLERRLSKKEDRSSS